MCYVMHDREFFRTHRCEIAAALLEAGAELHLIAPQALAVLPHVPHGTIGHHWNLDRWSVNPVRECLSIAALFQKYRALRPDIVHHYSLKSVLYGTLAARLCGIPVVVNSITGKGHLFTASGSVMRLLRWVVLGAYRFLMRTPRVILLFQTEGDRNDFVRWKVSSPAQSVVIPGSGVDVQRFVGRFPATERAIVLFAGRLLKEKGVLDFIDAVHEIRSAFPHLRYLIAGPIIDAHPDAVSLSDLLERCTKVGIEYIGNVEELSDLLANTALFCFPSRYGEGVPRVVLEAAASGAAIVCYPCAGIRETLGSAVVECAADPAALARTAVMLLREPVRHARVSAEARELLLKQGLDTESIAQRVIGLYSEALRRALPPESVEHTAKS